MQDAVGPLKRGLQILEVLAGAGGSLRPADLAAATGLARSAVDRVVGTLTLTGYLRRRGREVVATPRVMEAGNLYLSGVDPDGSLARCVAALADELDEWVSLAVPDGGAPRIVARSGRRRTLAVAFRVGDLLPAERCAQGPVLAAEWDEEQWRAWQEHVAGDAPAFRDRVEDFRRSGWSLGDQLAEPELVAVAVPVRLAVGTAALAVVSDTGRHSAASLRAHAETLVRARVAEMERPRPPRGDEPPATGSGIHGEPARGELKARLGAEFLQSLDRGLAVLHALGTRAEGLTLSEAAAVTGQPRATARRALLSLTKLGYARETGRRFSLLPRVLDLGYRQVSGLTFEELARPHLRDLVVKVHDSASVVVLDGTDIRYVARAQASRLMRVEISVGTRFPAYATAMGRVLMAGLPEAETAALIDRSDRRAFTDRTLVGAEELGEAVATAREDGYAVVDQELETGLRSIAVPIHAGGRVVAALNIAAPAVREPVARMRARLLPELRTTARALEADVAAFTRHQPLAL